MGRTGTAIEPDLERATVTGDANSLRRSGESAFSAMSLDVLRIEDGECGGHVVGSFGLPARM